MAVISVFSELYILGVNLLEFLHALALIYQPFLAYIGARGEKIGNLGGRGGNPNHRLFIAREIVLRISQDSETEGD